jgi:hypothetical protein
VGAASKRPDRPEVAATCALLRAANDPGATEENLAAAIGKYRQLDWWFRIWHTCFARIWDATDKELCGRNRWAPAGPAAPRGTPAATAAEPIDTSTIVNQYCAAEADAAEADGRRRQAERLWGGVLYALSRLQNDANLNALNDALDDPAAAPAFREALGALVVEFGQALTSLPGAVERLAGLALGSPADEYAKHVLTAACSGDVGRVGELLETAWGARWLFLGIRESLCSRIPAALLYPKPPPRAEGASEGGNGGPQPATSMTWQDAAERMKRLCARGEPWPGHRELANRFGCSAATIHKATQKTPELQAWSKRPDAAPRAIGQAHLRREQQVTDVVTDRTPQGREPDPEDQAAIREFIERADPDTKAWFLALTVEDQLDVVNDTDKHQKTFPRP